ncbi:GNAT family N-acetyltransferase [Pseudomonas sp. B22129]|uniref:GNAT family N-acetyltransferase n=1 Tax=Pseudomonas sp. B22129 TaxID=3235111 RepID=UPI00378461AD
MIRIHKATEADLDALREVGCETYREHFSTIWTRAGLENFLDQDFSLTALRQSLAAPERHLWLIVSDRSAQVVGFAKVNWATVVPVTGGTGAELQKIYFRQSAAGLGYGRQLLRFICEQAAQRGEQRVWLDVLKSNTKAHAFYEGFGFQRLGEIPFSTDLLEIGMRVMGFELNKHQMGK